MRVLHLGAEIFPLVKTGGLADVLGSLPQALIRQGADVRVLLPGLPAIAGALVDARVVAEIGPCFGAARVTLRLGTLPGSGVPAYVVDAPFLYRRDGGPYHAADGSDWPDNAQRFALLGWVGAQLAAGALADDWSAQVLHAHDWHAAMSCAYLKAHPAPGLSSVFTVHNLAYQGLFPSSDFALLDLPARFMNSTGLEYHQQLSFMKAGLKFAHRVTTVSPSYAREIATHDYGCGLDGVIRGRGSDVLGILNGVDGNVWNPATDAELAACYDPTSFLGKAQCKAALQTELGLHVRSEATLFGVVSRLSSQKGLDLVLAVLPQLVQRGAQLALQGSGDPALESAFRVAAEAHPGSVAVRIGYDEEFAHRVMGGADAIVVPSRFEPCGLTQLYGLRYGTVPVVRRVGGLADTVTDATEATVGADTATGFVFDAATPAALDHALRRAIECHAQPQRWSALMRRGMAQNHSWDDSARHYLALYEQLAR